MGNDIRGQFGFQGGTKTNDGNIVKYGLEDTFYPSFTPDWTLTNNGRGLLEGTCKFFVNWDGKSTPDGLPNGSQDFHPYDLRLQSYQSDSTFSKDGIVYCDVKYVGIENSPMTDPEFSLSSGTQDVSIRFHPDFISWCQLYGWDPTKPVVPGTAIDPRYIVLDSQGHFKSFGPMHELVPALENFLVPTANAKVMFYTDDADIWLELVSGIGQYCDTPPYGNENLNFGANDNAPQGDNGTQSSTSLSGPPNWLITGCSVSQFGWIFKVEIDCTLSILDRPMNPNVYQKYTGGGSSSEDSASSSNSNSSGSS